MSTDEAVLSGFPEREYISVTRCCHILGVNETVVRRLHASGLIRLIDHRPHGMKKVHYGSVVAYCNSLRAKFMIPDNRAPLVEPFRYPDADLLPFPLSDTMSSNKAREIIGWRHLISVVKLIDEGRILGYKLTPGKTSPWRISRKSVAEHMQQVMRGVAGGPHT